MANTLIDIENNTTIAVRLLNLTDTEQSINQDDVIGVADEFTYDVLLPIGATKNPDSTSWTIRDVAEKDTRANKDLPEHMKDLYNNAVDNNDFDEQSKEKIYKLLFLYTMMLFLRMT